MSDAEREAMDKRPYMGLAVPKSEKEAREMFRFKYNREPETVKPPDKSTPYWRVGPLTEAECHRWRGFIFDE